VASVSILNRAFTATVL